MGFTRTRAAVISADRIALERYNRTKIDQECDDEMIIKFGEILSVIQCAEKTYMPANGPVTQEEMLEE